jgi:leucyl-tRNA synthetase
MWQTIYLTDRIRYGQTNCFVGTAIKYGIFVANDKEAYVCTHRAARNMSFQGAFDVRGQVNQLAELEGAAIVGTKIKAPLSVYPEVHVLPMDNVLPTKVERLASSNKSKAHIPL